MNKSCPSQQKKIYQLLEERAELGIKCFEFVPLLGITQPNARILGLRKEFGCICKNTHGRVAFNCPASQHFVNDGDTTYLIKSRAEQLNFNSFFPASPGLMSLGS